MRRFLVAGNWKMNTTRSSGVALANALAGTCESAETGVEVLVCPPFPYLSHVGDAIAGSAVTLGAQDVYFEAPGAFTGEVAVEMLVDCGCQYVIVPTTSSRPKRRDLVALRSLGCAQDDDRSARDDDRNALGSTAAPRGMTSWCSG